ncbi:FHA domain-containing protein [Parasedimentitalea marina]|nr:FHA domain-containing protein [Parasedimentitalea marina]
MKFIRDIIADKREQASPLEGQVPPRAGQITEERSDQDVMAAILSDTGPTADPFHLDSSFQVSEPPVAAPPESHEPESTPRLSDLNVDNHDGTSEFGGLNLDAFDTATPASLDTSFIDAPESDLPDIDFQRLAASVPTEDPAPQDRPFKRFTRTQTRLRTLDLDEPEKQADPVDLPPKEVRQSAPPSQHPAPIRQKAEPAAAAPQVPDPVEPEPAMPEPAEPAQQMAAPERAAQPSLREQSPQVEAARPDPARPLDVPSPAMGRGSSKAGRVKTRLLGFNPGQAAGADPFARKGDAPDTAYTQFPVGWLAVVSGPGRGATFTLFNGVTIIGRGEDQTVRLDFGDNSISRSNHAAIAFDPEQNNFFIGHGGKANLVRRNDRPVLSTEELAIGDLIRIGETTLRFVPLCGPEFGWNQTPQSEAGHAS